MCRIAIEYYGCCRTTVKDVLYDPCSVQGCYNPEHVEEYNMEECSICWAERKIMEERERETRRREARERVEMWAMGVTGENNVDGDEDEKMMEGMKISENGGREPRADGGQGDRG
jgi:hypothetical protein